MLKKDKSLLFTNKDLGSKSSGRLKLWAQNMLDTSNITYKDLNSITIVKSKKEKLCKIKYSFTIIPSPEDIEVVKSLNRNT